jgi:hypothetical protein
VRLADPDVQREADVGDSERLQYFGQDKHRGRGPVRC